MEQENPPPPPLPDFDNISTALNTLHTKIPRLRNAEAVQQAAETRLILESIQNNIQNLALRFTTLETRFTGLENSIVRIQNGQRQASFPTAPLLPLRDPQTGNVIPNCPRVVADIYTLSGAEAARILRILRIPVPQRVADRREAVRLQFF
ncbi:hypothetical protein VE03_01601 [Pseudogymnoascus sp. 23342-1-I1]|nr:hypothetical protein VE03_01601 [Pseudogymnoascus sp. 23342-1-I1]